MKLFKAFVICASFTLLSSCSDQEPAATGYKKALATSGADATATTPPAATPPATPAPKPGTPPATGTTPTPAPAAGDKAAGLTFYTSKGCGGCHGADGKGVPPPAAALANAPYDTGSFNAAKGANPAHAGLFPTTPADTANVIAHINTFIVP